MPQAEFLDTMGQIASAIAGRPLDGDLQRFLNDRFPVQGNVFKRLHSLCQQGEVEGWLMGQSAGGITFGRAIKPGQGAGNFSVDVVRMADIAGPHYIHTTGEIGAILPISGTPKFDQWTQGWYVYPPGSDHSPTVAGGDAYILYLLPEGKIEFTGK